jgi:hypothetical protein
MVPIRMRRSCYRSHERSDWTSFTYADARLLKISFRECVLVKLEIHSFPAKGDAVHSQTEALLGGGFETKLNLASGAHHSLPREPVGRIGLKEARDSAMVQRVARRRRNLTVCGDSSLRNGTDDPSKGCITDFVRTRSNSPCTLGQITGAG